MIAVITVAAVVVFSAAVAFLLCCLLRVWREGEIDPDWWKIDQAELDIGYQSLRNNGSISSKSHHSKENDGAFHLVKTELASMTSSEAGRVAICRGGPVSLVNVRDRKIHFKATLLRELNMVRALDSKNLHRVYGVSIDGSGLCCNIVGEIFQKGSLMELLDKESIKLDWFFKNSLIKDLVMGMAYLHSSPVESHGHLNAHCCMVDSRFSLKISDYGITVFRDLNNLLPPLQTDTFRDFDLLLWRAPELLRQKMPLKGTQKGDVYSFAIILQQIILRSPPYDSLPDSVGTLDVTATERDIVLKVKKGLQPPTRPFVDKTACTDELHALMVSCWDEYPIERPPFSRIRNNLKKYVGHIGDNVIDRLIKRQEQHAFDLEKQISEKTHQYLEEKKRTEEILGQLLPKSIAESLTKGHEVAPEFYESVTIFLSDIVDFTSISAAAEPMDVVSLLNKLFTLFDTVLRKFDAYKVETIGDAYLVASGLPIRNGSRHAVEMAMVSLHIRKELAAFEIPHLPREILKMRIGVDSGSCVAGIVGVKMPRYCLFGSTVEMAKKLENSGKANRIHIGASMKALLDETGRFKIVTRKEKVMIKVSEIQTFWLVSDNSGEFSVFI